MITRRDARAFLNRCGFISKPLFLMQVDWGVAVTAELGHIKTGQYAGCFILAIHHEPTHLWAGPRLAYKLVNEQICAKNGKVITAWQSHKRYNIIFAIPVQQKLMRTQP